MAETPEVDMVGIASTLGESLGELLGEAGPGTVFSEPMTVGDDLVITAVAWERAGGFGYGAGQGQEEAGDVGTGGGGGGGGSSQGRPVAVIRVGPAGVEVTPVIDFTKIGVTLLLGLVGVWSALRRR